MGACTHPGFLALLLLIWLGAGARRGLAAEREQAAETEKEKQAERAKGSKLTACGVAADKESKTTLTRLSAFVKQIAAIFIGDSLPTS